MKAIGKRSVSSFLAALISAGFYTVAVVLVLMIALASLPLFTDVSDVSNAEMSIPVSFRVETGALRFAAPAPSIAKADIRDAHGSGTLRFPPPSGMVLTTTALLAALYMAMGLWVLVQLRAVFRTLRDGRPFVAANAMRIRWIGYAVILGEVVQSLVRLRRKRLCQNALCRRCTTVRRMAEHRCLRDHPWPDHPGDCGSLQGRRPSR